VRALGIMGAHVERMTLRSSALIMGLLLATAATGGGMLACSSSEEPPVEEPAPAPERATDETSPPPIASNVNSGEAPPADPAPTAAPATDAGTGEGGGTGTGPGTGGGNPGKLCEASSTKEVEDNNAQGAATAVPGATGSACGQLATKTDVDFFKFTLPADTTGFGMGYNFTRAGLKIEVTANGKTFNVGQTPELEPGAEYIVKVSTTGDGPVDYRWSMEVDK
jgi:hypothetical protein